VLSNPRIIFFCPNHSLRGAEVKYDLFPALTFTQPYFDHQESHFPSIQTLFCVFTIPHLYLELHLSVDFFLPVGVNLNQYQ